MVHPKRSVKTDQSLPACSLDSKSVGFLRNYVLVFYRVLTVEICFAGKIELRRRGEKYRLRKNRKVAVSDGAAHQFRNVGFLDLRRARPTEELLAMHVCHFQPYLYPLSQTCQLVWI